MSALNLFFGRNIQLSKDTLTELYENLTIETLRGKRQPKFDKISDVISDINFTMQRSIMSNIKNKDKATVNSNEKIKHKCNFVEQKNDHEKVEAEIVSDIINDVLPYKHIKTDIVCIGVSTPPQKHHPLFLIKPLPHVPLNLQTVQVSLFLGNPLSILLFCELPP